MKPSNSQYRKGNVSASSLGSLRNTRGSVTRIFKHCNAYSSNALDCVFRGINANNTTIANNDVNDVFVNNATFDDVIFDNYCILNDGEIHVEEYEDDTSVGSKAALKQIGFTPAQIKTVYSINEIKPIVRRPIVTIIAAFNNPYLARDIAAFGKLFNLPPCDYKIYNFSRRFSTNWAVEVTLNAQWIYAVNPYAHIRIVLAASSSSGDMFNAIRFANNKNNFRPPIDTDVMNMSWGTEDLGNARGYNTYFTNPNTIYVASSGNTNNVSVPSCCTNVLSVGGTSLRVGNTNSRLSETVWASAGCGYSKSFAKPPYQPTISNNAKRISPDCSCVADPQTPCCIVVNNKVYTTGGTSLAAPICVGIMSLLTQQRLNLKRPTYTSVANRPNSIQPLLYNSDNNVCFFDVVQGSSKNNVATEGFDTASGRGVLNASRVVQQLS